MLSLTRNSNRIDGSRVGLKLHKLAFVIDRKMDQILLESLGISLSQYMLMYGAASKFQTTQCGVAKFLNLTQAAISRQVEGLVERDLLKKTQNVENRREHLLVLTPAGQKTFEQAQELIHTTFSELLEGISSSDLATFSSVIERLLSTTCSPLSLMKGD
ncbi:MAG: MarR family winged helix-turn-helix transcriptional regulator [Candidatus Saccharimonadia bacterium]